jgi:hypothetical protein
LFEKPRRQFEGMVLVTQIKVDTGGFFDCTHLNGGSHEFAPEGK